MLVALAALVYFSRDAIERVIAPERPDVAAIAAAVDSAYARIRPVSIDSRSVDMDGRPVRCDYVRLSRSRSLLRANLELTRAVEKAGGGVLYGIESYDEQKRKQFLTLGISSDDSLVCEVKLERGIR
ncbi:MAG: hypothetical protein PVJ42_00695 [bacterium]